MVLNQSDPSFSEYDSSDPNSSSDPTAVVPIDLSQLPSPNRILGPLFFFPSSRIPMIIQRRVEFHQTKNVHRHLTPDEIQAVAYHAAKGYSLASLGPPLGYLVGLQRAYSTRANYTHPFTGPMKSADGWFDGERIRIMGREMMGWRAKASVHALRTTNYCILGTLFGFFLGLSYGSTVEAVGIARDSRLTNFVKDLRGSLGKGRADGKSAGDLWKEHRERQEAAGTDNDEARIADKAAGFEYAGDTDSSQMRSQADKWRQPIESQPNNDDNDFPLDSASPTAMTTGNTWERIRREASSTKPTPVGKAWRQGAAEPKQGEGSSPEDNDHTFSPLEQERSYAREEAQKEFDERVERERRGGDFGGRRRD